MESVGGLVLASWAPGGSLHALAASVGPVFCLPDLLTSPSAPDSNPTEAPWLSCPINEEEGLAFYALPLSLQERVNLLTRMGLE